MKSEILQGCNRLFVVIGLLVFVVQFGVASDTSRLSGSYQVISKTEVGSQTRVQLQLHLTNHDSYELHIRRITLWDFSHPGATQARSIIMHAGASVDTTQEFTIPRPEYELWSRGTRPRLVVEAQSPDGRTFTKVVRLERTPGRKAD